MKQTIEQKTTLCDRDRSLWLEEAIANGNDFAASQAQLSNANVKNLSSCLSAII